MPDLSDNGDEIQGSVGARHTLYHLRDTPSLHRNSPNQESVQY